MVIQTCCCNLIFFSSGLTLHLFAMSITETQRCRWKLTGYDAGQPTCRGVLLLFMRETEEADWVDAEMGFVQHTSQSILRFVLVIAIAVKFYRDVFCVWIG